MAERNPNLRKCKFCNEVTLDLETIHCRCYNNIETDDGSICPPFYEDLDSEQKPRIQVKHDSEGFTVTGHQNNNNSASCRNNDKRYAEVTHSVPNDQNYQTERGCPLPCYQSHKTERTYVVTGHHDINRGCLLPCYQSSEVTGYHKTERGRLLSCSQSDEIGRIPLMTGQHTSELQETQVRLFPHVLLGTKYEMTESTGTIFFIHFCLPAVLGTIFQRCVEDCSIITKLKASKLSSSKTLIEIGTLFHFKRYGEAMQILAAVFGIPQRGDTVDFCPNPGELPSIRSDRTHISVENAIQKLFSDVQIKNAVGHYEQYITSFSNFIHKKRQM